MTTLLEAEIRSQPDLLQRLIDRELAAIGRIAAALPVWDYALIAARGSSDHAALYAQYAWAGLAGRPVALAAPSLFTLYHTPPRLAGALVVGISQSGQSPDIVAVVAEGRRQGRPTIAVTNDPASPLAQAAAHVVPLDVGPERSVAATKTYTAQLAVIAAFAAHWSGQPERLDDLRRLPEWTAAALRAADPRAVAQSLRALDRCIVIGRGYHLTTAFELALKLKELARVAALAYSAADFRHGPIAAVDPGDTAIVIAPAGLASADVADLAADLRQRGAHLLVVADAAPLLALAEAALPLPAGVPEWLSPIPAIVPGQLLALHLALAKGLDPDAPRGLHKVTRTV